MAKTPKNTRFCKNTTVQCITGEKKLTGITLNDGDAHWAGDFSLVDRPQCWPTFSFAKDNPSSHRRFASNGLNCRKRRGNWALVSKLCDNFGLLQECYQNPGEKIKKKIKIRIRIRTLIIILMVVYALSFYSLWGTKIFWQRYTV